MIRPKPNILVFCAHPDDEVLGVGATIAKYTKEGKNITTIIFSYGELSHPWLKKEVIIGIRVKESKKAAGIIGSKALFFGLDEKDAIKEIQTFDSKQRIADLIKKYNPEKIFTHSRDDPHPLHQTVSRAVVEACDHLKYKDVYVFDIWNPLNLTKRRFPRLYVDVKDTFELKIKALKAFESQKIQMQLPLLWSVYVKAVKGGFESGNKLAEVFYKIR